MGDQGWTVNEWAGWLDGCSSVDTHRGPDAMPTVTQHLVVCVGGRGGGGGGFVDRQGSNAQRPTE